MAQIDQGLFFAKQAAEMGFTHQVQVPGVSESQSGQEHPHHELKARWGVTLITAHDGYTFTFPSDEIAYVWHVIVRTDIVIEWYTPPTSPLLTIPNWMDDIVPRLKLSTFRKMPPLQVHVSDWRNEKFLSEMGYLGKSIKGLSWEEGGRGGYEEPRWAASFHAAHILGCLTVVFSLHCNNE